MTTLSVPQIQKALESIGISKETVKQFGDLRKKQTWMIAYNEYCVEPEVITEPETQQPEPQSEVIAETVESETQATTEVQPQPEQATMTITNRDIVHLKQYLLPVKHISSNTDASDYDSAALDRVAKSILKIGGLFNPIIVRELGYDGLQMKYEVVKGHAEYHAAVIAKQMNLRQGEMINAYIIEDDSEIQNQEMTPTENEEIATTDSDYTLDLINKIETLKSRVLNLESELLDKAEDQPSPAVEQPAPTPQATTVYTSGYEDFGRRGKPSAATPVAVMIVSAGLLVDGLASILQMGSELGKSAKRLKGIANKMNWLNANS